MTHPLETPLTLAEAELLAERIAFLRVRNPSQETYSATFLTAADLLQAQLFIRDSRNERWKARQATQP